MTNQPRHPPSQCPEVCSRRRSLRRRRWARRVVAGLGAFTAPAFVLPPAVGLSRHTVTDDAMSGTMERGSVVFAKSQPVGDLEVGDIITYRVPTDPRQDLVTRRIVDIRSGLIWTSRDSTGEIDPWTLSFDQQTRDRAVVDIPYAGYVYDAVSRSVKKARNLLPN
ncbi:hypothetical protein [Nocardioides sp. B-3]|uniref:hypothetical protein n=1 Tax=Nocardioides sp. B-3 TaxID=2895565 RepID=UPI0021531717|nr:hypothetical protein [Nocardioides sp. B-3]UUZ60140.1 hypothetical protein LP418_04035 [Nocardioides sp. B-3]